MKARRAPGARGATHAYALLAAMLAFISAAPANVAAAPDEIQVYTDDVNEPGEFGLEIHSNYVLDGFRTPAYPGQLPTQHVLQMTPEFSYGFAKNWDAGLYLLSAVAPDGNVYGNGAKARIKYIAASTGPFFWGVNMEIGNTSRRISETNTNFELRPIIGWRGGKWLVSFNPIIGVAVSGDVSHEPSFKPALKVARSVGEGVQLGFEHYADMGGIHHIPPFNQQDQMLYAVVDIQQKAFDVNFGIGRGLTSASEQWVAKMIVGIPFK